MEEQKNNIRVLFTVKANSALNDIMKNFKLEETPEKAEKKDVEDKLSNIVVIDNLSKDFALVKISEKDLVNSLKNDLEVSQQTAEQISKEIIAKIIPFLEKVPEEKFNNPAFVEEISKKVFGETVKSPAGLGQIKKEGKDLDLFPKIKPEPEEVTAKPIEKKAPPPTEELAGGTALQSKRIKKPLPKEPAPQMPQPQIKQPKGKDTYREPIE